MAEIHHSDPEPPPLNDLRRWSAALLLSLAVIGFYWRIVLTDQFTWLSGSDIAYQVLPWLQFQAGEWHQGRIPLWDPYCWFGQSLVGQSQPGVMYPLNWILFLLPLKQGWLKQMHLHWYLVAIHLMGAWFAYKLARELGCNRLASVFGGTVFTLAGWMGENEWPQMLNGAVWMPLVFLYLLRVLRGRLVCVSAALAGFFLGMAWLSGHHQVPIYISLAATGLWLWMLSRNWRLAPAFGVFLLMTFLTGAAQLLPAQEYGHLARRWVGAPTALGWDQKVPYDVLKTFSLPPFAVLGVVFPNIFNVANPFVGITVAALGVLALAAAWRRVETRIMAAVALGGFIYAMGEHSAFHGVLYSLVPNLDKARNAAFATSIFGFGASMLGALGLHELLSGKPSPWLKRIAFGAAGIGVFAFAVRFSAYEFSKSDTGDERRMVTALVALLLAALLPAVARGALTARSAGFFALGLFIFEITNVSSFFQPSMLEKARVAGFESMRAHADIAEFLRRRPGFHRIDVDSDVLAYNFGDWYGLQHTAGYLASVTENTWAADVNHPVAKRLLSVAYYVARKPSDTQKELVFSGQSGLNVYYNPDVLNRVFSVHKVSRLAERHQASARLREIGPDIGNQAFVFDAAPALEACPAADHLELALYNPSEVRIAARMACRGLVILSDNYFPGWVARVDGREVPILETDGFVRGVVVAGGSHTIEYRFEPTSVRLGALLSLAGTLAALAALVYSRRQRRAEVR